LDDAAHKSKVARDGTRGKQRLRHGQRLTSACRGWMSFSPGQPHRIIVAGEWNLKREFWRDAKGEVDADGTLTGTRHDNSGAIARTRSRFGLKHAEKWDDE
jgi:hypothetical protein